MEPYIVVPYKDTELTFVEAVMLTNNKRVFGGGCIYWLVGCEGTQLLL